MGVKKLFQVWFRFLADASCLNKSVRGVPQLACAPGLRAVPFTIFTLCTAVHGMRAGFTDRLVFGPENHARTVR